jgi:hypothetical protein
VRLDHLLSTRKGFLKRDSSIEGSIVFPHTLSRPFFLTARDSVHRAGDIAQLARAAALQAVGRGFDSHYLHESGESARRGPRDKHDH